jgi:hypothetical protein
MKVAVVLTGHMRRWREVLPNFKERVVAKYNPDIFINTWNDEGWYGQNQNDQLDGFLSGSSKVYADEIQREYSAKVVHVDDFESIKPDFVQKIQRYPNYFHRSLNIYSMFYKMAKGIHSLENYILETGTEYDLVIRMRPDMFVHQEMPDFNPNVFYTIHHANHLGQGTGDMLQVGNLMNVTNFCRAIYHLPNIYNQLGVLCPHMTSTAMIGLLNLPWQPIGLNKELAR